jgi:predicted PurR-regulated permease PerM
VGPIAYNLGIVFTAVKAIILPFVFGFFIAFVLNPLMIIVEKRVVKGKFFESHRKFRRNTSIFVCYLLTLGFVIIVMAFFIPELFKNINNFLYILPENISVLEDKLNLVLSSTTFARIKDIDGILNYVLGPLLNVTKDSTEIIRQLY